MIKRFRKALPPKRSDSENRKVQSLAVLPLINTGLDETVEYLSDGITESIISSLSRLPQLRVMARSSVVGYKGREIDQKQVGRELRVEMLLTGKVVQLSDRLVIRVELVDSSTGGKSGVSSISMGWRIFLKCRKKLRQRSHSN